MKLNRKIMILLISIIFLISVDQLTKYFIAKDLYKKSIIVIKNVLKLTYVENTGGAFGIGNNNIFIFIIINLFALLLISSYLFLKKDKLNGFLLISLVLMISGGIGNLLDRTFRGYVIDYIDINQIVKYPMFNFADVCIVIGCLMFLIGEVNEEICNKKRK